jgi:hypothetical protein
MSQKMYQNITRSRDSLPDILYALFAANIRSAATPQQEGSMKTLARATATATSLLPNFSLLFLDPKTLHMEMQRKQCMISGFCGCFRALRRAQ